MISLTVLNGRLATLVAQVEPEGLRLYQYHPALEATRASTPAALRRLEYLERSLLGGHLDAAKPLAIEIAETAADDPFAGCLCGYVLLRLGMFDELNKVIEKVVAVAPGLSDIYILRGEHAAATGGTVGRQSFADATATGSRCSRKGSRASSRACGPTTSCIRGGRSSGTCSSGTCAARCGRSSRRAASSRER